MRYITYLSLIAFLSLQAVTNARHSLLRTEKTNSIQQESCLSILTSDCPDYKLNCEGKIEYSNGEIYIGEISYGEPHGKGKYWCSFYDGEFIDGYREGWGSQELDDGSRYEGNWNRGFMEGVGYYEFACGQTYSGTFYGDVMHGMGTLEKGNGETYAGEWKNGKREGEGVETFLDGSRFVGNFKKGKRQGLGGITWKSGEAFSAIWKKDKINGEAEVRFSNGDKYVCRFKKGVPTGESSYVFENGRIIEGDVEFIEFMLAKESTDMIATLEPNLGFASYAMAVEFKKIKEFELAEANFKQAQNYLPNKSALANKIPDQMAALEEDKGVN